MSPGGTVSDEERWMDRAFGLFGAALGFMAVALGAFGAHMLEGRLAARDLEIFETAVRYQMYHALALVLVAALIPRGASTALLSSAGWAFAVGVFVFSGSLYLLVFTGVRGFGAVTPIGGVALLAGWALLFASLLRTP